MEGKSKLFRIFFLNFLLATRLAASNVKDEDLSLKEFNLSESFSSENETVYSNETFYSNETVYSNGTFYSNESTYQCLGASKGEMKTYSVVAWWMDAVCQVCQFARFANLPGFNRFTVLHSTFIVLWNFIDQAYLFLYKCECRQTWNLSCSHFLSGKRERGGEGRGKNRDRLVQVQTWSGRMEFII